MLRPARSAETPRPHFTPAKPILQNSNVPYRGAGPAQVNAGIRHVRVYAASMHPSEDAAPTAPGVSEKSGLPPVAPDTSEQDEPEPAMRCMERELEQMKLRLRQTVEHHKASTEELKA